jgi:predicted phage baseplate assembly protein
VSTLEVRVNEVLWEEVPSLYGRASDERVYVIRRDDDHNSYVVFGDGRTGARLPTGANNVTALYRRGIGTGGNVRASQISTLMNKPVGVKGGTNPVAATGAGDPEQLEDARTNASLTALTLGRVVSIRDYEDFSRAYPGIAKASASWSWNGERRHILLTVAGDGGAEVDEDSDLAKRLRSAIRKLGDEQVGMTLKSYDPLTFTVKARVKVDPAYLTDTVFENVRTKLSEAFSFDARSFGQAVSRAEVMAVMHQVEGVIAVDIEQFYSSEGNPGDDVQRIGAQPKTRTGPVRLLTLDTTGVTRLEVMK